MEAINAENAQTPPQSPIMPSTPISRASQRWRQERTTRLADKEEKIKVLQLELEKARAGLQQETNNHIRSSRACEALDAELKDYKRRYHDTQEKLKDAQQLSLDQESRASHFVEAQEQVTELRELNEQLQAKHNLLEDKLKKATNTVHRQNRSISSLGRGRSCRVPMSAVQPMPPPNPWSRTISHKKSASMGDAPKRRGSTKPLFTPNRLSPIDSPPMAYAPASRQALRQTPLSDRSSPPGDESYYSEAFEPPYSPLQDLVIKAYLVRCHIALASQNLAQAETLINVALGLRRAQTDGRVVAQCKDWRRKIESEIGSVDQNKQHIARKSLARKTTSDEASTMEESSDVGSAYISVTLDLDTAIVDSRRPSMTREQTANPVQGPRSISGMSNGRSQSVSRRRPSNLDVGLGITASIPPIAESPLTSRRISPPQTPPRRTHVPRSDAGSFVNGFTFPPAVASDLLSWSPNSEQLQGLPPRADLAGSPPVYTFSGKVVSPPAGTPGPTVYSPSGSIRHERVNDWLTRTGKVRGIDVDTMPTSILTAGLVDARFPIDGEERVATESRMERRYSA